MAKRSYAARLDAIATRAADAAEVVPVEYKGAVEDASKALAQIAAAKARRERDQESAIAELPFNATASEVSSKRYRQATRKGKDVYLPSWDNLMRGMPSSLLRTGLFSCSSDIQKKFDIDQIDLAHPALIHKEIATFNNISVTLTGFELCQFDRHVYATCVDYYRHRPLMPPVKTPAPLEAFVQVSFYEFARSMGGAYGPKTHKAIRDSLLRLSAAHIRIRSEKINAELPKLLVTRFDDGFASNNYIASDKISFQVPEAVAELFGPGEWAAIEVDVSRYDGLKGWLAHFYATHSAAKWLHLTTLYDLSGYTSHYANFKASLLKALEALASQDTPLSGRIKSYCFSADQTRLLVHHARWDRVDTSE